MTRVKICGIRRLEDAIVAAEAGADFLGFVFYERSKRLIEPEAAREIAAAARERTGVRSVGVFVNASPHDMNRIARVAGLDYIQLSGDEDDAIIADLDCPAIQVIHVHPHTAPGPLSERIAATPAGHVLLDTGASGSYGGTGAIFDWTRVPATDRPFLLAGGLHPDNVGEAVRRVQPWGVDVSSGVESGGWKDHTRIRAFIGAAKGNSSHGKDDSEQS